MTKNTFLKKLGHSDEKGIDKQLKMLKIELKKMKNEHIFRNNCSQSEGTLVLGHNDVKNICEK